MRPLAQRLDERKADVNKVVEPLAENYLRLNSLGAYGAFFNIYFCSTKLEINGPQAATSSSRSAARRTRARAGVRKMAERCD